MKCKQCKQKSSVLVQGLCQSCYAAKIKAGTTNSKTTTTDSTSKKKKKLFSKK